jgi:methylated-DNA-[protein]-cysteine S-methyltransferase
MTTTATSLARACSAQTHVATPLGRLLLARTAHGLAGAWFEGQRHHPPAFGAPFDDADALLCDAAAQLTDYFAGARTTFDVACDLHGTAFQRAVWDALRAIPAGVTRTYADVARSVGAPAAVRAVGAAIGRNPISIIVPCHRVVGSDGSLTGYAGGTDRKAALLALERAGTTLPAPGRGRRRMRAPEQARA